MATFKQKVVAYKKIEKARKRMAKAIHDGVRAEILDGKLPYAETVNKTFDELCSKIYEQSQLPMGRAIQNQISKEVWGF